MTPVREALKIAIEKLQDIESETGYQLDGDFTKPEDGFIARLQAALSAAPGEPCAPSLPKRPFAFAVERAGKRRGSVAAFFMSEADARAEAEQLDGEYEGLYRVGDRRSAVEFLRREAPAPAEGKNQAELLLNAAMDHIAGTLEQPTDMRAWSHLLIYCPDDIVSARAAARPEARLREHCIRICLEEAAEWDSDDVQTLKNYAGHCANRIAEETALSPPSGGDVAESNMKPVYITCAVCEKEARPDCEHSYCGFRGKPIEPIGYIALSAKNFEGGVEGHANPRMTSATTTRYPATEGERHMVATARRTEEQSSTKTGPASIKPGPSEPSPPADRREIVWFDAVLQKLKDWRAEDHEDNIFLSRHEVCTILDQFAILAALPQSEEKKHG